MLVKPSTLPNTTTGNGLFAAKRFLKGEIITEFAGDFIDASQAQAFKKSRHLVPVQFSYEFIDGLTNPKDARGKGGGSFANDPGNPTMMNAGFITLYLEKDSRYTVVLSARKDIKPGEEIFVSYN